MAVEIMPLFDCYAVGNCVTTICGDRELRHLQVTNKTLYGRFRFARAITVKHDIKTYCKQGCQTFPKLAVSDCAGDGSLAQANGASPHIAPKYAA